MINRGLMARRYLAIRNAHFVLREQIAQLRRLREEVQIAELKAQRARSAATRKGLSSEQRRFSRGDLHEGPGVVRP